MRLTLIALALAAAPLALAETAASPEDGHIELQAADGAARGRVALKQGPQGIVLRIAATGLTPGWHGLHFHAVGDCSDGPAGFKKAGSHVGHGNSAHGFLAGPEAGDLPNLYVAADGTANAEIYVPGMRLWNMSGIPGTSLIIHANEDDHISQPIGNAGDRVACGVLDGVEPRD
jgi:Cu-Zn family superoxide dismutase